MAEILFVYPKTGFELSKHVIEAPLSLLSLASNVAYDYDTAIMDQRVEKKFEEKLLKTLAGCKVVFLSSMTGTQIKYALRISELAKENSPAKVVWGGMHTTLFPEQTIAHPMIDCVAIGEGEYTVRQIAESMDKDDKLKDARGILYKNENNRIIRNPPQETVNLDSLPRMPYYLLDMEKYVKGRLMIHDEAKRNLPFISTRGCPWRCSFCSQPAFSKRRWNAMSAEKTAEEVKYMVDKFNLDAVTFYDENFLSNPKRAEQIAALIGGKFEWGIQTRMDDMQRADMRLLAENGLKLVQPGIESGSNRILQMIKKDETAELFLGVNRALAELDLTPVYNFMMGFPTETYAETMMTVDLALAMMHDNPNARIAGFYTFVPYPGTELFDVAVSHGFQPPDTLEGWIDYTRHHNLTPWLKGKEDMMKNITFTSKFVDSKRMQVFVKNNSLFKMLIMAYGRYNKLMWQRHKFENRFDIGFAEFISRRLGVEM